MSEPRNTVSILEKVYREEWEMHGGLYTVAGFPVLVRALAGECSYSAAELDKIGSWWGQLHGS